MRIRTLVIVVAAVILVPVAFVHGLLRASLPKLDGQLTHMGVVAPVTIDRDERGIPTIEAANRVDLAFGTGFVHGQDRFFQMDLLRRLAAGELSELFGKAALEQDEKARIFRFRNVARESLRLGTPEQRAVLEAYARGVNAGLRGLRSRPWEYWLLRSMPADWRPEDTVLVSLAMWWDLQYLDFDREIVRQEVNARLGGPQCESGWKCGLSFLYPAHTPWDAPNSAGASAPAADSAPAAIPPPEILDVRGAANVARTQMRAFPAGLRGIGSNNWAVAGRLTATGAALVANDMHLSQRVPPTWYRARLRITGSSTQPALDLNGVTLPGAPLLVAGSNGHIAWGFTNSYGDWIHVQHVACSALSEHEMQTPEGPVPLSVRQQEIRVHGEAPVIFPVQSGPGGVLYQARPQKRACWFVTWLAQQPAATNMNLMGFERASSVQQALALAPGIGIPQQNLALGDAAGHIAWTIAGRIPVGTGIGRTNGSAPWTTAETHPRIVDPPAGRIWSANARATDDEAQESAIGGDVASVGAGYDLGARARQIRDDLLAMQGAATPVDMLRIQLDDRAVFLTRWQTLLLSVLDADSLRDQPRRAEFRRLVSTWEARASVDSVGYRLVRAYRDRTEEGVWEMVLAALGITRDEQTTVPDQFESALWRLVNEQPMHMLAASYRSWHDFLLAQVDATLAELSETCRELAHCTWGARKPVRIRHPLSRSLPLLSRLLDMPTVQLPGDHDMPRVQDGPVGASERFAVSPGHEDQGYLELPGGQSGHPLSAYYRSGFRDWAEGIRAPFLPGPARHRLTLQAE
ncbi:MAG TPA: penicillin acylase family protein [Steroidobacteraceae bacterium]|nr:penicillin acylase family protein [Steroidobacteraceae bacterium]